MLAFFLVAIAGCKSNTGDLAKGIDTLQEGKSDGKASFHPEGHFTSIEDFFNWVNRTRKKYSEHSRASGHPCDPSDKMIAVGNPVFPLIFIWDNDLAERAQREADRLAAGGAPSGVQFTNQGYDPVYAWGKGYFTEDWVLSAFEKATKIKPSRTLLNLNFTNWNYFPLGTSNGMARIGLWFQDFRETGPVITKLGIGASATANGTWWVLQFGP